MDLGAQGQIGPGAQGRRGARNCVYKVAQSRVFFFRRVFFHHDHGILHPFFMIRESLILFLHGTTHHHGRHPFSSSSSDMNPPTTRFLPSRFWAQLSFVSWSKDCSRLIRRGAFILPNCPLCLVLFGHLCFCCCCCFASFPTAPSKPSPSSLEPNWDPFDNPRYVLIWSAEALSFYLFVLRVLYSYEEFTFPCCCHFVPFSRLPPTAPTTSEPRQPSPMASKTIPRDWSDRRDRLTQRSGPWDIRTQYPSGDRNHPQGQPVPPEESPSLVCVAVPVFNTTNIYHYT